MNDFSVLHRWWLCILPDKLAHRLAFDCQTLGESDTRVLHHIYFGFKKMHFTKRETIGLVPKFLGQFRGEKFGELKAWFEIYRELYCFEKEDSLDRSWNKLKSEESPFTFMKHLRAWEKKLGCTLYDAKDYAEKTAETGIILMDIEEMKIDDRLNPIEINAKIEDLKNKYEFLEGQMVAIPSGHERGWEIGEVKEIIGQDGVYCVESIRQGRISKTWKVKHLDKWLGKEAYALLDGKPKKCAKLLCKTTRDSYYVSIKGKEYEIYKEDLRNVHQSYRTRESKKGGL